MLGDLEVLALGSYLHGGRKILEGGSFGPCGTQAETVLKGIIKKRRARKTRMQFGQFCFLDCR